MQLIATAPSQRLSWQRVQPAALPVVFVLFGLIMGSWAGRIPGIQADLHIPHSALSMVLLCGGVGAVISYPVSSWMMARLGGRKTVLIAGLALLAALVGIGWATEISLLMTAVFLMGIPAGCLNVGMNAVATSLEKKTGKSTMARLHAGCCAGGLAGATLGGFMASKSIAPASHFLLLAAPLAVLLWLACHLLKAESGDDGSLKADAPAAGNAAKTIFAMPRGPLTMLGALVFLGAMSEGSIADWSGVFLKDHFGVTDGVAPLAYSAFLVTMLLARLAGDHLKRRHGARPLVSGGATLAAAGLLFSVLADSPYLAMAGFGAAGFGLALVFPFVFSAAGKQGPVALAGVATMAYSGSLMGPPVIGALAHGFGMQAAIGFIGVLAALIAIVAARAGLLR
ncbi:MFS transporter [Janthinobacterium sp. 17J80-10]|uniref:MFS transporter n=1 Tax=Janthinobacterium sp. 17J80-10 TaxID=2497863 RepID=UPI0010053CE1|nr:MFS transporter [Janthinobacterium sp. 17J80-10]QAU33059.1 MFS transporter [Janthinobacterium sp. 17J80-10]